MEEQYDRQGRDSRGHRHFSSQPNFWGEINGGSRGVSFYKGKVVEVYTDGVFYYALLDTGYTRILGKDEYELLKKEDEG